MTKLLLPLFLLLCLTACSVPADKSMLAYEQSLSRADSLVQSGAADSAQAARLLADLHQEYTQVKESSDGKLLRLAPGNGKRRFLWLSFTGLMIGLNVWLSIKNVRFLDDRKHRRYLIDLSENEQRLRNNERERNELEACLSEMSLTDNEREEVLQSLTNLIDHGNRLHNENESLLARLKEYEKRPLPRDVELLKANAERAHLLDEQVQSLTATLIDGDALVSRLRLQPKFLTDNQWDHLRSLTDRVYNDFSQRLTRRFPQLTAADVQLCLLMRLRFTNAQIATLIAVSPASVSQQKFRLKKRLMQTEEALFEDGETLDGVLSML